MPSGLSIPKQLTRGVLILENVNKNVNGKYKCTYSYWTGNATSKGFHHSSKTYHLQLKTNDQKNNKPTKKSNGITISFKSKAASINMSLLMLASPTLFIILSVLRK